MGFPSAATRIALVAATFFLVALATSRVALVGHELIGHGVLAVLFGAQLTAYRLFLFGGGWVSYRWSGRPGAAEGLAVSLGGIGLELLLGGVALLVAFRVRPASIARVALLAVATLLLLHGGFYLAAGTHHGFGDGRDVHEALGSLRPLVVVPVSLAVVAGGYLLAARLAREVSGWVPGGAFARAASLAAAALIAAGGHAALTYGERSLVRDDTYARIMEHESVRLVARDLDRFADQARLKRGRAPGAEELAAARAALEKEHRPFPLAPLLAVGLGVACLAGLWQSSRRAAAGGPAAAAPDWRALLPLAVVCAASIGLVALLQALAP